MAGPRQRRRAGFEAVPRAHQLDPDLLDAKARDTLLVQMTNEGFDKEAARAFIGDCVKFAQMVSESRWRVRQGAQRAQLEAVGLAAEGLRAAIESLDEGVSLYWQRTRRQWTLTQRGRIAELSRKSPLAAIRDTMLMAEEVSRVAAARIDVSRRRRVTEEAATGLALLVLRAFRDRFGVPPPTGSNSWFPVYMKDLGKAIGIACGVDSIARAMKGDAVNGPVTQSTRTGRSAAR